MNIYKITNIETGLSYIGKDQRDCEYYMGSGLLLWNSYRKRFGREDLDDSKKSHHKWVYEQNKILGYYEKTIYSYLYASHHGTGNGCRTGMLFCGDRRKEPRKGNSLCRHRHRLRN